MANWGFFICTYDILRETVGKSLSVFWHPARREYYGRTDAARNDKLEKSSKDAADRPHMAKNQWYVSSSSSFFIALPLLCGRANVVSGFSQARKGNSKWGGRVLRRRKWRSDISHIFLTCLCCIPCPYPDKKGKEIWEICTKRNFKSYGRNNRIKWWQNKHARS